MDNKQMRLFYLVALLLVVLFYDYWHFFLRNKWQQSEVSVIELTAYREIQNADNLFKDDVVVEPTVVVESVVVAQVKENIVPQDKTDAEPECVFQGNKGYLVRDGKSTYPSVATSIIDEEGLDDF